MFFSELLSYQKTTKKNLHKFCNILLGQLYRDISKDFCIGLVREHNKKLFYVPSII